MRFQFLLAVLCIVPFAVLSKATPKFAKAAVKLASQSKPPNPGSYYFKNVKTGQMIAYAQKKAQSIYLSNKGSPMTARKYGKYMKVTPTTSNNKCFSAQWHFGRGEDWAAVLYACSKNNKHTQMKREQGYNAVEKRAKMGPVRPDKQLWIVRPGSQRGTYNIIATDHIMDQSTKAMADCTVKQVQDQRSTGICLEVFNPRDKGQLWTIHDKKGKMIRRDITEDIEEEEEQYEDVHEFDSQFSEDVVEVDADEYSEAPEEEDFEEK